MTRLVEWDSLELRIDGERLAAIAKAAIGTPPPLERVDLKFTNGLLRVFGSVRKYLSIPFNVDIVQIVPAGSTVRVPIQAISAAGFPVPRFLLGLIRSQLPPDVVTLEEPSTFVVSLDRFLPKFVSVEIQSIWIVDGGLVVTLGRGGADLPQEAIDDAIRLARP